MPQKCFFLLSLSPSSPPPPPVDSVVGGNVGGDNDVTSGGTPDSGILQHTSK